MTWAGGLRMMAGAVAIAVLVENGGSGSRAAAPIARKVMDHYFQQVLEDEDEQLILTAADTPVGTDH